MKIWIGQIARFVGLCGACLMIVAGLALGLTVPVLLGRSLVVGATLYLVVWLIGRIIGETIVRLAVRHEVQQRVLQLKDRDREETLPTKGKIDQIAKAA